MDLISLIYAVNENNKFQINSSTNISASIVYKKFYLLCILVLSISTTNFEINQKIFKNQGQKRLLLYIVLIWNVPYQIVRKKKNEHEKSYAPTIHIHWFKVSLHSDPFTGRFLPSELVQDCDISIHVVEIVAVGWVLILAPVLREGSLQVKLDMLCLRFIIHGIKPTHLKTDGWFSNMHYCFNTNGETSHYHNSFKLSIS